MAYDLNYKERYETVQSNLTLKFSSLSDAKESKFSGRPVYFAHFVDQDGQKYVYYDDASKWKNPGSAVLHEMMVKAKANGETIWVEGFDLKTTKETGKFSLHCTSKTRILSEQEYMNL